MTFQTDIYNNVIYAKRTAACWSTFLISKEQYAESTKCCEKKLMLLVTWIEILESYYCENFDASYGTITPDFECLTADEAQELLSKLKILIGVA